MRTTAKESLSRSPPPPPGTCRAKANSNGHLPRPAPQASSYSQNSSKGLPVHAAYDDEGRPSRDTAHSRTVRVETNDEKEQRHSPVPQAVRKPHCLSRTRIFGMALLLTGMAVAANLTMSSVSLEKYKPHDLDDGSSADDNHYSSAASSPDWSPDLMANHPPVGGSITPRVTYLSAERRKRSILPGIFFGPDRDDQVPDLTFVRRGKPFRAAIGRSIDNDASEYSDVTQLYPEKDSADPIVSESMERRVFPSHESDEDCVPMAGWQTSNPTTCNTFHELDMNDALRESELSLVSSKGNWKHAWKVDFDGSPFLMKTLKYEHDMQDKFFEFNRVDAIAMERLTASPYVMNVYGMCGLSLATEFAPNGSVSQFVDKLIPRGKLKLAKMVAEGVAAVHEIEGGKNVTLVHNDINFGNIFMGRRRYPLLNDFNIAILMMRNKYTNKPCPFTGYFPNPQWRSPEEQRLPDGLPVGNLTEKVDIYGLGNIFFRFIVGKAPWRKPGGSSKLTLEEKEQIAAAKLNGGKKPAVPGNVRNSTDPSIIALLNIMNQCYRLNPADRPTARQVVNYLDKKLAEIGDR